MMPNAVMPEISQLEPNPRIVGMAESILQQNAAILQQNMSILEINQMLISTLMQMTLVIHEHIEGAEEK